MTWILLQLLELNSGQFLGVLTNLIKSLPATANLKLSLYSKGPRFELLQFENRFHFTLLGISAQHQRYLKLKSNKMKLRRKIEFSLTPQLTAKMVSKILMLIACELCSWCYIKTNFLLPGNCLLCGELMFSILEYVFTFLAKKVVCFIHDMWECALAISYQHQ